MQVILLEKPSTWVTWAKSCVRDGYARNFLIPEEARRATDAALKEFEARRALNWKSCREAGRCPSPGER